MKRSQEFTGRDVILLQQQIEEKMLELARRREELSEREAAVRETAVGVNALQSYLLMLEELLAQASSEVFGKDSSGSGQEKPRNPMEMIRPQFKGMQLGEIVGLVLRQKNKPLSTTEIGHIIYDAKDKQEFARARNSLSTELRSGAGKQPPRWQKIGRSNYAALSYAQASSQQVLSSENFKGGEAHAS